MVERRCPPPNKVRTRASRRGGSPASLPAERGRTPARRETALLYGGNQAGCWRCCGGGVMGATRVAVGRLVFVCLLVSGLAVVGCTTSDGFRCGEPVPGGETGRECGRPEEVCVCATRSCATPDLERDAGEPCESGMRYLGRPFARSDIAGECVPADQLGWVVRGEPQYLCANSLDGAVMDAGIVLPDSGDLSDAGATQDSGAAPDGGAGS